MNVGVKGIKQNFAQFKTAVKHNNPAMLPVIVELEDVAIKRATGKMSPSKARSKINSCCMKAGISPGFTATPQFDFNPQKKESKRIYTLSP